MKTKLNVIFSLFDVHADGITQRFAAHCTAVVIVACLLVGFALPGPACARFYADNGDNIAPSAMFEGNNAEWYDTQLAALINTTGPNAYAPGRPGRIAFNYPDSSTPTTVWAGTNTNQVPQSYSISLWFKTDRTGGVNSNYMFLIGKKNEHMEIHTYDAGGGRGVLKFIPVPGSYHASWDGTTPSTKAASTFALNEWNHVVATYDWKYNNDSRAKIYLNGVKVHDAPAPQTDLSAWNDIVDWHFGRRSDDSYPFFGQIEEVAIFGGVLTDAQVSKIYNYKTAVTASNSTPKAGDTVTLTATLPFTAAVQSGHTKKIVFKDGDTTICDVTLTTGTNTATCTTPALSSGTHTFTAVFSDTGNEASLSSGITHTTYEAMTPASEERLVTVDHYGVTYNSNCAGGTCGGSVPVNAISYQYNAAVTVADNTGYLTKTGYTFSGWTLNSDGSGTVYIGADTFTINTSVTVYAKWTANVTYDRNCTNQSYTGGVPIDNTAYLPGASVTVSNNTGNLTKTGYTFAGWGTLPDGGTSYIGGNNFTMTGAITLYAQWVSNISLSNLIHVYDGSPKSATATTKPTGQNITITYRFLNSGSSPASSTSPSNIGSYEVVATIVGSNPLISATGTLNIIAGTKVPVAFWSGNGSGQNSAAPDTPVIPNRTGSVPNAFYTPGRAGQAFSLRGTNYFSATDPSTLHIKSYSISLWFKANTNGQMFLTAQGLERMEIHTQPNGAIRFIPRPLLYVDTESSKYNPSQTPEWVHVVATFQDDNFQGTVYVNGKPCSKMYSTYGMEVTSGNTSGYWPYYHTQNPVTNVAGDFFIGKRSGAVDTFNGLIEQVAVYDSVLSEAEINLIYNSMSNAAVALGSLTHTYDSTAKNATATTTPSGKTVTFTYCRQDTSGVCQASATATAPIEVGSYTVVGTISEAEYPGEATGTLRIIAAPQAPVALWGGNGSYQNSITPGNSAVSTGTSSVTYTAGRAGQAFSFSGSNYLTVADAVSGTPSTTPLHISSYSISLWFKASSTGTYFLTGKEMEHMEIHTNGNGSIRFIPVTRMYVDTPESKYSSNTWTHVVVTYDFATGTGTIYVNGTKSTTTITVNYSVVSNGTKQLDMSGDTTPFTIGARKGGDYKFAGQIEQVAVFNGALTAAEVTQLYNGKLSASVSLSNLSQDYTGQGRSATATTTPAGRNVVTYCRQDTSGVCQASPTTTAPIDVGSYTVVGTIFDNSYEGSPATGTLTIRKGTPVVSWTTPGNITYGTALGVTQLNATAVNASSATVVGTFVYSPVSGTVLNGGNNQVLSVLFTPASSDNYTTPAAQTVVINVNQAVQTITFGTAPTVVVAGTGSISATGGGSGNAVTFTSATTTACTVSGSTVTGVNAGTTNNCTIKANQGSNSNYFAAPEASRMFNIGKGAATVSLSAASLIHSVNDSDKSATATTTPTGKTVLFTYNGSSTPPSAVGQYAVTATIDDSNYQGSSTGTLTVNRADFGITSLGPGFATLNLSAPADGTGYFTLLSGNNTSCGTATQIIGGADASGTTAFRFGSLPLTADVTGHYTLRNLAAGTSYTLCFTSGSEASKVMGVQNVITTAAPPLPAVGPPSAVPVSAADLPMPLLLPLPRTAPRIWCSRMAVPLPPIKPRSCAMSPVPGAASAAPVSPPARQITPHWLSPRTAPCMWHSRMAAMPARPP